jgi:predicted DNA-binding helix-hairpin-helix protein
VEKLPNKTHPNLDSDIDPKLSWALRNMQLFPVDVNRADKWMLARIPGIGMK